MSDTSKPPTLFWIISGLATIWYIMGCAAYYGMATATVEGVAEQYGQGFADIFATKPSWATAAFAIAVFGGLLGCIALLLRKSWAKILFILSLLGVIIHNVWGVSAGTLEHVGTFDKVMTVAVLVIAIFMVWFAHKKSAKGYLS